MYFYGKDILWWNQLVRPQLNMYIALSKIDEHTSYVLPRYRIVSKNSASLIFRHPLQKWTSVSLIFGKGKPNNSEHFISNYSPFSEPFTCELLLCWDEIWSYCSRSPKSQAKKVDYFSKIPLNLLQKSSRNFLSATSWPKLAAPPKASSWEAEESPDYLTDVWREPNDQRRRAYCIKEECLSSVQP